MDLTTKMVQKTKVIASKKALEKEIVTSGMLSIESATKCPDCNKDMDNTVVAGAFKMNVCIGCRVALPNNEV